MLKTIIAFFLITMFSLNNTFSQKNYDRKFHSYNVDTSLFQNKFDFPTTYTTYGIASADLNSDGLIDIVTTSYAGDKITVYQNIGISDSIAFKKLDVVSLNAPQHLTIGDIDNDYKPDLVVVSGANVKLEVYRNNSSVNHISFEPAIEIVNAVNPNFLSLADLNHDHTLEIISPSNNVNMVYVYRNISTPGNILFDDIFSFPTEGSPNGISVGDINNDSLIDIAVPSKAKGIVSVLENNTSTSEIQFYPMINFPVGTGPEYVVIKDLNIDGKNDLTVLNTNGGFGNTLSVLKNINFNEHIDASSFSTHIDFTTDLGPVYLNINDLDNDNYPELIVSNILGASISVLKNNSSLEDLIFGERVNFDILPVPYYFSLNDFDNDFDLDIAVTTQHEPAFSILINNSDFIPAPVLQCPNDIVVYTGVDSNVAIAFYTPSVLNTSATDISCFPPSGSLFPIGISQVRCYASNESGTDSCSFYVTVIDSQKPKITLTCTPQFLWPPNHKMRQIDVSISASDNSQNFSVLLLSVTSDEADNGTGNGDKVNDIQQVSTGSLDTSFLLRAERAGNGNGRNYSVTYSAIDNSGNQIFKTILISVPHSLSKETILSENIYPEYFFLQQNFPNPFNPSTSISYALPARSHVKLSVFNSLGQQVAELVNREQDANYYEVKWEATTPSGLYLYRLDAVSTDDPTNTFSQVRKMLLLR
ncbi:MAG: VCBS repeat-containing protein [Ignavibacteriae bacterium]|nr:VCBS repeat-containing protein [Ignavibacteriota bacterium]